ncbi:hypothetical protein [Mangrovicoccus sp. HB161399]|uniref:hypothetical protein n=1 Tax=Mangrovicoccus sp. HB161399 TaxID=2720392 RepID=UPI001553D192|nr:hypothetical protein [Mangrovicoccus sp. HB161399]
MDRIVSILARFPDRELDIRRRCATDQGFRGICSDYEEATQALRRWQDIAGAGCRQAADYAALLEELEREILALLDARPGSR